MVVEDEVLLRLTMIDMLEPSGFEVVAVANAEEAIEILKRRPDVKVVVTDINMPGSMDGLDLIAFVKSKWPRIALIVMSGKSSPNIFEKIPEGGLFFSKPYDVAALVAAIEAAAG